MQLTAQEISRKYDRFARWYDVVEGVPDLLIVRKLRKRLLQEARGRVLEVAVGTGKNLPYYNTVVSHEMTAIDISKGMLDGARIRANLLSLNLSFAVMDAEALSFPDETFDTVISSLTMCTFPNPVSALRQMARVCKRGGRVLLLEHGRSDRQWLGRWQDRRDERRARQLGCHWNRRPLAIAHEAGLDVVSARRTFLGVFYEIVATV